MYIGQMISRIRKYCCKSIRSEQVLNDENRASVTETYRGDIFLPPLSPDVFPCN